MSKERGTVISAAPKRPTYIPKDILKQILDAQGLNYYYSDDYENDASVKIDQNGNITYYFNISNDLGLFQNYTNTQYYFEVKSAKEWQAMLDFEIYNLFDNEIVGVINYGTGLLTPPGVSFEELESVRYVGGFLTNFDFYAGAFEVSTSVLAELCGDSIKHNTKLSEYLFGKVIDKNPEESVAILKSVTTKRGHKYAWEDSYNIDTFSRKFY